MTSNFLKILKGIREVQIMAKTNKELLEELTIKVDSLIDHFFGSVEKPTDVQQEVHEKEIDLFDRSITAEDNEDLQAVHDDTKPPIPGECQECGEKLDQKWKTWCAYHYATIFKGGEPRE